MCKSLMKTYVRYLGIIILFKIYGMIKVIVRTLNVLQHRIQIRPHCTYNYI